MKQIKIKKEFWCLIVSGQKKFEFRKLEKGLTTGTYKFVSLDKKVVFGTAHLEPIGVESIKSGFIRTSRKNIQIEISSYNFIKEHYEGKYDYVAYEISNIKEFK